MKYTIIKSNTHLGSDANYLRGQELECWRLGGSERAKLAQDIFAKVKAADPDAKAWATQHDEDYSWVFEFDGTKLPDFSDQFGEEIRTGDMTLFSSESLPIDEGDLYEISSANWDEAWLSEYADF